MSKTEWPKSRLRRRTTRPCYGCGGERTCVWSIDAWVCNRCGDEWYPDHGIEYHDPSEFEDFGFTLIELAVLVLIIAIVVVVVVTFLHPKTDNDGPPEGSGWTEVPSPDGESTLYERSYRDGNGRACIDHYAKTAQGVAITTDCGDEPPG